MAEYSGGVSGSWCTPPPPLVQFMSFDFFHQIHADIWLKKTDMSQDYLTLFWVLMNVLRRTISLKFIYLTWISRNTCSFGNLHRTFDLRRLTRPMSFDRKNWQKSHRTGGRVCISWQWHVHDSFKSSRWGNEQSPVGWEDTGGMPRDSLEC